MRLDKPRGPDDPQLPYVHHMREEAKIAVQRARLFLADYRLATDYVMQSLDQDKIC
jgi:hypothetical protein